MKALFGVSSVGLGHARRSLAVARELREIGFEIEWVSSEPVISFLTECGEKVHSVSRELGSLSAAMEKEVNAGELKDISYVARASSTIAKQNYSVLRNYLDKGRYDILIQDEFAETMFCFMWDKHPPLPPKRVIITDYLRFETRSPNPLNRITIWYANRLLARAYATASLRLFADSREAIPKKFEKFAENFEIVGPISEDIPGESREVLRKKLFPNLKTQKLVVVSLGGTTTGKFLLDFIVTNSRAILDQLGSTTSSTSLVLLLGPRINRSEYPNDLPDDLILLSFTHRTLEYFKAADCVVTQAGASTLNEVAAVGTPCLAVPIGNHWEQEANAKRFSEKFGFVVVRYGKLVDSASFAKAVENAMNCTPTNHEPVRFREAAMQAARMISNLTFGHQAQGSAQ